MPDTNLYKFNSTFHQETHDAGITYRGTVFYRSRHGTIMHRQAVVGFDSFMYDTDKKVWYEIERNIRRGNADYTATLSLAGMSHDVKLIDSSKEGLYGQIFEYVTEYYAKQESK